MPRPSCVSPTCRVQRWPTRWNENVQLESGEVLAPIPIIRFRCRDCRRELTRLPSFLVRRGRYLAMVRDRALVEYAETQEPVTRVLAADGPCVRTVERWVRPLEQPEVVGALEVRLQARCLSWREQVLPLVEQDHPRPGTARPLAWRTLQMLRCLVRLDPQRLPLSVHLQLLSPSLPSG